MAKDTRPLIQDRLNKAGGQAVIEGVMMKAGDDVALALRKSDGTVELHKSVYKSARKKYNILNIPVIRGIIGFVESMILSFKTLSQSADALGIEDEETKFDKWIKKHFGKSIMDVIIVISTVLGLVLGIGLFTLLPTLTTKGVDFLAGGRLGWFKNLIEGVIRIGIFVLYVWLVSFMPDIRRTYEYHGAEHKTIAAYERGLELTPDNVRTCTRFHPRCGTSFLIVMLVLSIIVFSFVTWDSIWVRVGLKILFVPLIVGLGFEYIMATGKRDNWFTRILSAPGLWMQRITTRDPDDSQMEIAITALKASLPDDYPDADPHEFDRPVASPEAEEDEKESGSTGEAGGTDEIQ